MFSPSPNEGVLRQGEIVSGLVQVQLRADLLAQEGADVELEEKVHPFALIVTQDCDLDWDFKARSQQPEEQADLENKRQGKLVPNIYSVNSPQRRSSDRASPEEMLRKESEVTAMNGTTCCLLYPPQMIDKVKGFQR